MEAKANAMDAFGGGSSSSVNKNSKKFLNERVFYVRVSSSRRPWANITLSVFRVPVACAYMMARSHAMYRPFEIAVE